MPQDKRLIVVIWQWTFGCRAGADGQDGCLVPRVGWWLKVGKADLV